MIGYGGKLTTEGTNWAEEFWIDLEYATIEISGSLNIRFRFINKPRMENQIAAPPSGRVNGSGGAQVSITEHINTRRP